METKACTGCKQDFPVTAEYFYWQKVKRLKAGGRWTSRCKTCILGQQHEYYVDNAESVKERTKDYNIRNADKISARNKANYAANPEPSKTRTKKWREDNPERKKQADKDYAARKPEVRRAAQKRYLERHPERRKLTCKTYREKNAHKSTFYARDYRKRKPHIAKGLKLRRRARERSLPATLTADDWQVAITHFDNRCAVCGKQGKLAADHWIPVTKGGGSTKDNIVPLCHGRNGCNNSKGNRDARLWLMGRYDLQEVNSIMGRIEAFLKGSL